MEKQEVNYVKIIEQFGIEFKGQSPNGDHFADCPFTGKTNKFSLNPEKGQWASGGKSGNIYSFLSMYYNHCLESTLPVDLKPICEKKNIPEDALYGIVAYNRLNDSYMLPCRNDKGAMISIGHYQIEANKIFRTASLGVGLTGIDEVKDKKGNIFITEGEWDYLMLKWLFKILDMSDDVVLCVPGALAFKKDWARFFVERNVYCCYDNDDAGAKGEKKASLILKPVVKSIKFLGWDENLADGYDLRDFITDGFSGEFNRISGKKANEVLEGMVTRFVTKARLAVEVPSEDTQIDLSSIVIPTYKELQEKYSQWLKIHNYSPIAIMYATIFANKIGGDPIWTLIVSVPGDSKTELLMTLSKSPRIVTTSTLTRASLISGIRYNDGQDQSLLLKADQKNLVVKDFTSILTMNSYERDEIFGVLRDAYDGKVEKHFATCFKSYTSRFGILAAVTPVVDSYQSLFSSLGERFIKFRLNSGARSYEEEEAKMQRALDNISQEHTMREELQDIALRFIEKPVPETLPNIKTLELNIIKLARFSARLRGSINKDHYTKEHLNRPIIEVGTRLAKQFAKLAMGLCIYYDSKEAGLRELKLLRMVARDTCPDRVEDIVRRMVLNGIDKVVDTKWIAEQTLLSPSTLTYLLPDLQALNIIHKEKGMERVRSTYRLHPDLVQLIKESGVYQDLLGGDKAEAEIEETEKIISVPKRNFVRIKTKVVFQKPK